MLNYKRSDAMITYIHKWDNILNWHNICPELRRVLKTDYSPLILFWDYMKKFEFYNAITNEGFKYKHDYVWHKTNSTGNFRTVAKLPAKNVESVMVFGKVSHSVNYYNSFNPIEKWIAHKYCYYCETSTVVGDAKDVTSDYTMWLDKCLKGDAEALEHIRFGFYKVNHSGDKMQYKCSGGLAPALKYVLDNIGTKFFIKDDGIIYRRYYKQDHDKVKFILDYPIDKPKIHPTQKPLELMKRLVSLYTKEGDTVLDFCMGVGTTGLACKELKRYFIGIEKDEKYFNVAKDRLNNEEDKEV